MPMLRVCSARRTCSTVTRAPLAMQLSSLPSVDYAAYQMSDEYSGYVSGAPSSCKGCVPAEWYRSSCGRGESRRAAPPRLKCRLCRQPFLEAELTRAVGPHTELPGHLAHRPCRIRPRSRTVAGAATCPGSSAGWLLISTTLSGALCMHSAHALRCLSAASCAACRGPRCLTLYTHWVCHTRGPARSAAHAHLRQIIGPASPRLKTSLPH